MVEDNFLICSIDDEVKPVQEASRTEAEESMPDKNKGRKPPSRKNPQFIVEIEGENMETRHYTQFIEHVYVEDTCDKIPITKVIFNNSEGRFTNEPLFDANKKMKIYVGYPEAGMEEKVGEFITRPASQSFSSSQTVVIEGWGEEVVLSFPEKRKIWKDVTDSEIAQQIAKEAGFKMDISNTPEKFDQVTQANESDMNFLIRRAKLYGYVVYVKHNTLHFHPPRYVSSEIVLTYRDGDKSTLTGFTVGVSGSYRAKRYKSSHIDPITQDIFTVEGKNLVDEISKETGKKADSVDLWDKLMAVRDNESEGYIINEGHSHVKKHYQQITDVRSNQSRWVIKGSGKAIGLQSVNAGETIGLAGLGRWSGEYLLTKVCHDYSRGGYSIFFDVTRTWTGSAGKADLKQGQTSRNIPSTNTVNESLEANIVEVSA